MNKLALMLAMVCMASATVADEHEKAELDFGDFTSVTLMVKAWEAIGEGEYANAITFTEKCTELYEEQAREMQATLDEKPSKDVVNEYWALNDVGTCYFIRGQALEKLNKDDEALAAYKTVVDDLYYSQAWDPKGWYWAPADAAAPRIKMLEVKKETDF